MVKFACTCLYLTHNRFLYNDKNQLEMACLDQLVPTDHLLRKIENAIDFTFIHKLTKDYYSEFGRPCLDTIILFKIAFLNYIYGNTQLEPQFKKLMLILLWFLNLSLTGEVPNYSTFSQNYIRKYKDTNVFEKIFTKILTKIIKLELIDSFVL